MFLKFFYLPPFSRCKNQCCKYRKSSQKQTNSVKNIFCCHKIEDFYYLCSNYAYNYKKSINNGYFSIELR